MRPAEFIRFKQMKIYPCGGRALHRDAGIGQVCEEIMTLALEPQNYLSLSLHTPCLPELPQEPFKNVYIMTRLFASNRHILGAPVWQDGAKWSWECEASTYAEADAPWRGVLGTGKMYL